MKISFESKGDFNGVRSWLKGLVSHDPTAVINQIARDGERSLSSNTPRETGATAAGWKAEIKRNGKQTEIAWVNNAHPELQVNLAKLIELGHGTGTGGYVQPRPYIKRSMDSVFNNAGDKIAREVFK